MFIGKLSFANNITAGLFSFFRLIWHSKKLRWSKTGFIKKRMDAPPFSINIHWHESIRKIYLRTYEGDIDIFYEIFWKEIYALPQMKNRAPKTIVDLGANVGLAGLYFLREFPGATIICAEPDKANFKILAKNFEQEVAAGSVLLLECAVMDKAGSVAFVSENMKYNSRVEAGGQGTAVQAESMHSILDLYDIDHVDLLKIDVEGAEKYIFSSGTTWLDKVENVLIELHSSRDFEVCMNAFQKHRFSVKPIHADPANSNLFWAKKEYAVPPVI